MSFNIYIYIVVIASAQFSHAVPLAETENVVNPLSPTRIIGGSDAPLGYAPHMVGLVFGEIVIFLVCGGSLISQHHVLTAAHCVESFLTWDNTLYPSLHGVIGTVEYDSLENIIKFSDHVIHPKYDRWDIKNDIGVLTTAERIKLSKYVAVIPLNFDWVGGDHECSATGWGLTYVGPIVVNTTYPDTKHLQKLKVNTLSPKECEQQMSENLNNWITPPPVDPELEICTYHSVGKGMCNGDSGSALKSMKTGEQVGIVSWGFPCALGMPDVFVRVSGYKDFLVNILKNER